MPKPIETLSGADATAFQGAIAPHVSALLSALGALASVAFLNHRATIAEAVADFSTGTYFSSAESGSTRIYKRVAGAPGYQDLGPLVGPQILNLVGGGAAAPVIVLSSGEMFNNGTSNVPRVPTKGLFNIKDELGNIHVAFWPDLDGDGDYDADVWFKSNGYLAATASIHFRFGDNDQLNGAGFAERGRIRIGCIGDEAGAGTTNVNFLQSGVNFSGTQFNDFAIGKYSSSDWWTYWDCETGNVGVGTAAPRVRHHVYGAASQNALFESSAATSRICFRGASQTDDTTAAIGVDSGGRLVGRGGDVDIFKCGSTAMQAAADNTLTMGSGPFRWSTIFAGTGTINTSDEREKQDIEAIPDAWLDAWGDVQWARFKFRDAVERKGEGARWHIGVIAQRVRDAFAARGLDAFTIGLLCYDAWGEETEPVFETVTMTRTVPMPTGRMLATDPPQPEVIDIEEAYDEQVDTGEIRVTLEAGNRWGIRYDQAFALEAAWTRRALSRLTAVANTPA